ncbi:hypothetical protein PPL_00208 [Heterostelium album PN500]|uniref:Uncharacterized protein n=1 Tax=Heterostelium pallidum (strain ATCC 26659 / Pp 5 / PN500) TaxID=670386 RepID=D3AVU3_HETP5|nr:hypothetical protein PPL_00208 [Heterostelium album PN500]EFA86416.1 hypothetical protein PPL_00208 [Heterostelium album PN500]|eukprot:XP_020438521.1 hypothetical protein PPL_00208 [Heterostelium album PN500]
MFKYICRTNNIASRSFNIFRCNSNSSSSSLNFSYFNNNISLNNGLTIKNQYFATTTTTTTTTKTTEVNKPKRRPKKNIEEIDEEFIDLGFDDDKFESIVSNDDSNNPQPINSAVKDILGHEIVNPISRERKKLQSLIKETSNLIKQLNKPVPSDPSRWSKEDQVDYLEYIFDKLDFFSMEDWYRLTVKKISDNQGDGLLRQNHQSAALCVINNFPEYKWDITKFARSQANFWQHKAHQRLLLNQVLETAGLDPADPYNWYQVTFNHINAFPQLGKLLRHSYNNDLALYLNNIYRFDSYGNYQGNNNNNNNIPIFQHDRLHHSWRELKIHEIEVFGQSIGITELDQWYDITSNQLNQFYANHPQYHSLIRSLVFIYPDHPWDPTRFKFRTEAQNERKAKRKLKYQQQKTNQIE